MQNIRYIGKKERKVDNVIAGTGIVWNGQGDVQAVPDSAVKKLLEHTDSFELATDVPPEAATTSEPPVVTPPVTDPKKDEDDNKRPSLPNLETMDKDALKEFAQREFGHQFHPNTGEAKMRAAIVGLMNRG